MSEETTTETALVEETIEAVEPEATQVPEDSLDSWKRNARKWEKLAKADADAAARWRKFEAAQKPIQERLAEELAATKAEAESARAELLRLQIASAKGITGDATKLLRGSTQEELEAEADTILSLMEKASTPKSPLPDSNQGKPSSSTAGAITDVAQLDRMTPAEIMQAKADGRLDGLLGKI
jgi:hypothetical protein